MCFLACLTFADLGNAQESNGTHHIDRALAVGTGTLQETMVTIAQIDAKTSEIESAEVLDEASAASAKEFLQQAKQLLVSAEKFKGLSLKYRQGAATAPDDIENAKRRLSRKSTDSQQATADTLSSAKAELDRVETELAKSREQLAARTGEASRRQARLLELPGLSAAVEQKLKDVRSQLESIAAAADAPLLAESRQLQLQAQGYMLQQELESYSAERQFYIATTELIPLAGELLQRQVERLQNQATQLKTAVALKRESEIEKLLRRAKAALAQTPAPLATAAQLNVELVTQYDAITKRLGATTASVEKTRLALEEVASEFKTSRERVEAVGLNETLGLMFRQSKSTLATQRRDFLADGTLQTEINELQIDMFRLQDLVKKAFETDASIESLMTTHDVARPRNNELHDAAVKTLKMRREVLAPLTQATSELFNRLVALDTDRRKVVNEIDAFTAYINEHVLWIRSGAAVGRGDVQAFKNAVLWISQSTNWLAVSTALLSGIQRKFGLFLFLSSTILLLMFSQRRMRLSIEGNGVAAEAGACREFAPTAFALLGTLAVAAVWPLVLLSLGWLLVNVSSSSFVQALSHSLISVALTIYPFELVRQICRNHGLGESHFDWAEGSRKFLRSNLRWLIPVLTVLLLFVNLLQYQPSEEFRSSLGRGIMAILLLVPLVYIYKVLHPNSLLYRGMDVGDRDDYWYRFRLVRFVVANVIVAALMLFTLGGYHYTTYQIGSRLLQTNALIVGVSLAFGIAARWLLVRRRRMKLEQMSARREEIQRQSVTEGGIKSNRESIKVDLSAELGIDATDVSRQARELILVGIGFVAFLIGWNIWADVIPAIGILDKVGIWTVSIQGVDEMVTLKNLLHFGIAIAFTLLAVKNLPGILELLLLKRLPLDSGARYAVATILRYVISVVGMFAAVAFLKIQWSQFSWLVAAISVGLGFGLQEIVANFVSGLILLLERPVRIGDVVTIEGTTGVVTKIQMRATTVTNWDHQELVVPNKNLITSSIFNWTLSNVLTRITLEVGVAYGTDPEQVKQILLAVVESNEEVKDDPPPSVTFQTFGESSLNFVIRCCISGPDKRLAAIHNLQVAISGQLKKHNIEIPFPQRVVHSAGDNHVRLDSPNALDAAQADDDQMDVAVAAMRPGKK